jgi:membrane protease YdiL (CAAX protease family)
VRRVPAQITAAMESELPLPGLVDVDPPRALRGGVRQSLWLLLVAWTVVGAIALAMLGGPQHLQLGLYQLVGFLFTAMVFVKLKGQKLRHAIRLRWVGCQLIFFAAMVGCGASAITVSALIAAEPWIGPVPAFILQLMPVTWHDFLMMLLIGCVGAGVSEEIFFRGLIQGILTRRGRCAAIVITAILFGAMHLNLFQFTGGLIMGIVLGWVVERSGSVLPAIVVHIIVNGLSFSWYFAKGPTTEPAPWWLLAAMGAIGLVGVAGFVKFTAGGPRLDSTLKQMPLRVSKKAWLAVLAPLVLFGGVIASGHAGAWRVTPVGFDLPALGIEQGDYVCSLNTQWFPIDIRPGDGVLFLTESRLNIGPVASVTDDRLAVDVQGTEVPLSRTEVVGKVVHKLRLPWWDQWP